MENRDDKFIHDFLWKNRAEIEDNGFSRRVMNSLPVKNQHKTGWIVPLFTLIGIATAAFLIDFQEIFNKLVNLILVVPIYYLLGGVMVLPIIFLFFYFFWDKNGISGYKL